MFRLGTPFVIWWAWVIFAIANAVQVILRERNYFTIEVIVALLAVTGLAYACTLRPRVVADKDGVCVRNPFRDHWVPWRAVKGVFLAESVEFHCARTPPKKDTTIYCWALYTSRSRRRRFQMQRSIFASRAVSSRAPREVGELAKLSTVQLMANELARRAKAGRQDGAGLAGEVPGTGEPPVSGDGPGAAAMPAAGSGQGVNDAAGVVLESQWAWLRLAGFLIPALALLGLILGR